MGFAKGPDRVTDNMKSTWRQDKSQWKLAHRFLERVNAYGSDLDKPVPVFQKTDPIPYMTQWSVHRYILVHALWPLAVQKLYMFVTGYNFSPLATFLFYTAAIQLNAIHEVRLLRRMSQVYGFLDGDKHARDEIPDVGVEKVVNSVMLTTFIRVLMAVFLSYASHKPTTLSAWLPLELSLYPVVLDLFFYTYHRACHEVDVLWKYHRTHHLTKHPIALMSSYADAEQEVIEIALIPLMTYATLKLLGMPMPFYDWWICHSYTIFSEALGHCGLRVWVTTATTMTPLLRYFNMELALEDHDLHHRNGWRSSYNYGKATRVWDRLFGTCGERIEGKDANIDYTNKVDFPLF